MVEKNQILLANFLTFCGNKMLVENAKSKLPPKESLKELDNITAIIEMAISIFEDRVAMDANTARTYIKNNIPKDIQEKGIEEMLKEQSLGTPSYNSVKAILDIYCSKV